MPDSEPPLATARPVRRCGLISVIIRLASSESGVLGGVGVYRVLDGVASWGELPSVWFARGVIMFVVFY